MIVILKYQRKDHPLNGKVVGRIHWIENVKDDDTDEVIEIKRSRVVAIGGDWVV
jgi:hypothetical protein